MNMKLLEILPTIMSHCHCWCCCWEYFHLGLWLRISIFSTLPVKIAEAFVGGRTNREKEMVRRHKSGSGKVTNQEWTWITNPCNVSPVAGSVITGHLSVRHSRLFVPRRSGGRVWYLYIYLRWPEHVIEIETHNRTQPTRYVLLDLECFFEHSKKCSKEQTHSKKCFREQIYSFECSKKWVCSKKGSNE